MCSFSSAKPANVIAMVDTIYKPFLLNNLKYFLFSLDNCIRPDSVCRCSSEPLGPVWPVFCHVLQTIFLIWYPLDQLASARTLVISTTWSLSTSATHARAPATTGSTARLVS